MTVGQAIRHYRKEKGMTQEELAKAMGYKTHSAIAMVEKDINGLSLDQLRKIAGILEVDIQALIGDEKQQADQKEQDKYPPPYDIKSNVLGFRFGRVFEPIKPKSLNMSQLCTVMWLYNRFMENPDSLNKEEKQYLQELLEHCIIGLTCMQHIIEAHGTAAETVQKFKQMKGGSK